MGKWLWIGAALLIWAVQDQALSAQEERQKSSQQADASDVWQAFDWQQLMTDSEEASGPWLPFLRRSTLSMGVYRLEAGGRDGQSPHAQDEVYYIAQGKALLQVEEDEIPVKPGSVVYVKAGAAHRFHSIQEELVVLVFFSAADPPEAPKPRGSQ